MAMSDSRRFNSKVRCPCALRIISSRKMVHFWYCSGGVCWFSGCEGWSRTGVLPVGGMRKGVVGKAIRRKPRTKKGVVLTQEKTASYLLRDRGPVGGRGSVSQGETAMFEQDS